MKPGRQLGALAAQQAAGALCVVAVPRLPPAHAGSDRSTQEATVADSTCQGRRWVAPPRDTAPERDWLHTGLSWPALAPRCPGCADCAPAAQVRLLAQALEDAWRRGLAAGRAATQALAERGAP